jgi:hypothetical protein
MPQNQMWLDVTCYGIPDRPPDFVEDVENPHCDFCFSPDPRVVYDCPDFATQGRHPDGATEDYYSKGEWFACGACSSLIDNHKVRALVRRSQRHFRQRHGALGMPPSWLDYCDTQVDLQHRTFFRLRDLEKRHGRREL